MRNFFYKIAQFMNGRYGHDCEGEQPEEENLCPISQKTRRKRFHTQQDRLPLL